MIIEAPHFQILHAVQLGRRLSTPFWTGTAAFPHFDNPLRMAAFKKQERVIFCIEPFFREIVIIAPILRIW
jgi:hypothetical protein